MADETAKAFLHLSDGDMTTAIYKMAAHIDWMRGHIEDAIELLPERPGRARERLKIAVGETE